MAITSAFCNSAKVDFLSGVHQPGDTYKAALYLSAATLDATTTVYSATNEVANGNGYTTGGATLAGASIAASGSAAVLDFSDVSWPSASFTARGMLIYNASRSNKAVAVLDFGSDRISSGGTFAVQMPTPDAANGLIRIT